MNRLVMFCFPDETVFNVLSLADEYQVELLTKRCVEYLTKKCYDPDSTLTDQVNILLCAERYSLKELYNACFDTVSKASPSLLKQVGEFVKLSDETREKFRRLRSQALDVKLTGTCSGSPTCKLPFTTYIITVMKASIFVSN